jgi:hypothetical protein
VEQEIGILDALGDALVGQQFADVVAGEEFRKLFGGDVGVNRHGKPHAYIPAIPVIADDTGFARRAGEAQRRFAMSNAPLMPKATAVWLVENTALSFDQVADFCKLHPLEVKAIADGDAAQGIKGMDPISTGQLTREEIEKGEEGPDYRLKLVREQGAPAAAEAKKKGPRYTPVSRRQDRPNAILWLVRNHPELKDAQIMRLVGTTKSTIAGIRDRTHWNASTLTADGPGDARPVLADRSRLRGAARRQGEAAARRLRRRDAAAGLRDHARKEPEFEPTEKPARRPQRRCGVRQAQADRRQVVENCHIGSSNITCAAHTPRMAPAICAAM